MKTWVAAAVLVSCVCAFLCNAGPSTWGDAPRVATYGGYGSQGQPVVRSDGTLDSVMIRRAARNVLVCGGPDPFGTTRPDIAATMRFYNPNIKIVFYSLIGFHWVTPPGYYDPSNHQYNADRWRVLNANNGFLYGLDGQVWFENYNVNMANRNVAQGQANLVRAISRTHIGDGWFFDDFHAGGINWTNGSQGRYLDYVRAGFLSLAAFDSAYKRNCQEFIDSVRVEEHGLIFYNSSSGDVVQGADGAMREGVGSLISRQNAMIYADTSRYAHPWLKTEGGWYDPFGPSSRSAARVNLALASMGHGWSFYGPNVDNSVQPFYGTWQFDEYAVRPYPYTYTDTTGAHTGWLGAAGDKVQVAPNAWLRWFDKGAVLLNLSDVPVTFNLTVTFKRITGVHDPYVNNGREGQSFTVPAHDALFVVRKPRPKPQP